MKKKKKIISFERLNTHAVATCPKTSKKTHPRQSITAQNHDIFMMEESCQVQLLAAPRMGTVE